MRDAYIRVPSGPMIGNLDRRYFLNVFTDTDKGRWPAHLGGEGRRKWPSAASPASGPPGACAALGRPAL